MPENRKPPVEAGESCLRCHSVCLVAWRLLAAAVSVVVPVRSLPLAACRGTGGSSFPLASSRGLHGRLAVAAGVVRPAFPRKPHGGNRGIGSGNRLGDAVTTSGDDSVVRLGYCRTVNRSPALVRCRGREWLPTALAECPGPRRQLRLRPDGRSPSPLVRP